MSIVMSNDVLRLGEPIIPTVDQQDLFCNYINHSVNKKRKHTYLKTNLTKVWRIRTILNNVIKRI